jgi:hypothetical protein
MAQRSTGVASFYESNRSWTERNLREVFEAHLQYHDLEY